MDVRCAALGTGGTFHLEVIATNGLTNAVLPVASIPDNGSWSNFAFVNIPNLNLAKGRQILRLAMNNAGVNGFVATFDGMRVYGPTQFPYYDIPVDLPGSVEAENFDVALAPDTAYSDTTSANEGGAYRPTEEIGRAHV